MTAAKTHADSMRIRTATIVIARNTQLSDWKTSHIDTVKTVLTPDLKFGFAPKALNQMYKPTHVDYGFLESLPAGVKYGIAVLKGYVDDMKYVFTADGAKSLGGFGAIGSLFPATWDWYLFWKMTAFLSIILAFMNILPIPALDLPALRDHHPPQAQREFHDQSRICRLWHPHPPHACGQPQRHPALARLSVSCLQEWANELARQRECACRS